MATTEGSLKNKWRRHAAKRYIQTRAMSPHQIPGLPDILAVDIGVDHTLRGMNRTRQHWIEAKVARLGPRTPTVFDVGQDATPPQALWLRDMVTLGISAWWLILSDKHWLLVPGMRYSVKRTEWNRNKKEYGDAIHELYEPSTAQTRQKAGDAMRSALTLNEQHIARLFV